MQQIPEKCPACKNLAVRVVDKLVVQRIRVVLFQRQAFQASPKGHHAQAAAILHGDPGQHCPVAAGDIKVAQLKALMHE